MRNVVLCSGMAFALSVTSNAAALAQTDPQGSANDRTFVIETIPPGGNVHDARIGAGVAVRDRDGIVTIVTCAHLLDAPGTLIVLDRNRRAYSLLGSPARIPRYDLALLRVNERYPIPVPEIGRPQPRERVFVDGHPAAGFWYISDASVVPIDVKSATQPRRDGGPGDGTFSLHCETCAQGDSGGGVFAADGKLIGILRGAWTKADGSVLFLEAEPLAPALRAMLP